MDDATKKIIIKANKSIVKEISTDEDLHKLLQPFFIDKSEGNNFIKKCLIRLKTRRILLLLQWYIEIADDMKKVKQNRPALCLVFLMSLAESVARQRMVVSNNYSLATISKFFECISQEDKESLQRGFKRALLGPKTHTLRFSSIVRILYDIRNKAVHGEDFWSFNLLKKEEKEKYQQERYASYGMITSGSLGKRGKKKRVSLDIALTYEDLRDIFLRTAIANIKTLL